MNIRIVEAKVMYMSFEISQMPNIYYYGVLYSSIDYFINVKTTKYNSISSLLKSFSVMILTIDYRNVLGQFNKRPFLMIINAEWYQSLFATWQVATCKTQIMHGLALDKC